MDWVVQYWPVVAAAAILVLLLVGRPVVSFWQRRARPRHTGERTIRVVGVGGAGSNAVDDMVRARMRGVDHIVINTDGQALDASVTSRRIRIGDQLTHGLGTGGDPAVGRSAAEEDLDAIRLALDGADLVFVAAGLGGGTGSGAGPLVAAAARQLGALTIGVVTMPFAFEGPLRRSVAETAAEDMLGSVDTLLVIENDRAAGLVAAETSLREAFRTVNEVLGQAVRGVADIMTVPGLVNLDFADVRAIMRDGGLGIVGVGRAAGDDRATAAAEAAVASPLLSRDVRGAQRVLLNVAGSSRLTLGEVIQVAETVRRATGSNAKVIFGATFDDRLKDELRVTAIATRFGEPHQADASEVGGATRRARRRGNDRGTRRPKPATAPVGKAVSSPGPSAVDMPTPAAS